VTTYFAWVSEGEHFDPNIHGRCDLDILELTIDHREGEVALANVVVAQATLPVWDRRHVFISHENTLLFSGRLVGLPVEISNELVSLELTAEPVDAYVQLENIGAELKQPPYWDSSFVEPTEHNNPAEWLEARSALFAWDRTRGSVCLSDLFQGRETIDYTDTFFADSLRVRLAETPLSHVSVILTAEWVQESTGEVSLGGKIAAAFPGGMINTLTPKGLKKTWFQEGQKLGRTGYWVVKSELKEVMPPRTGILDIYPTLTPEFMSWDESKQAPQAIRARRFWMSGNLILGWRYRQKRRENIQFTLAQKTQLDGRIRPLTRTLNIRLQQIVPSQTGTFFLTRRGRQTVEHAIELARAHLAASVRCLEVEITLPFEASFPLSLDHCVHLEDARIPGGFVTGKVIAYQLHQDGMNSVSWVRLAASIGGKPVDPLLPVPIHYVDPDYADTAIPRHHQTVSGLLYENYFHQRPKEGIIEAQSLSATDLIQEVMVSCDAQRQIHTLQNQQYPFRLDVKNVLEEVPTVISLNLLSLKTTAVAEHTINLSILNAWTAPIQAILGEEYHEI
jgi:hypothetical protein